MRATDIIARKRDGCSLTAEELSAFVAGYTRGEIPDYQAAALLMAIYLRGMDAEETANLTEAMVHTGQRLDLSRITSPTLDKHSTGGVGDKTTLIVVPLLAAAGVAVCKMSGRGLGHTGGTLDKLEAISGLRVHLTPDEVVTQVAQAGACLVGQTADLAPADRKLYALRDATATVGSLPLIASSILSKKLAGGAASFLFDVKVGGGALMKTEPEALALAKALVDGARRHGRNVSAVLSDMSQPLGYAVGNALEVAEAVRTLTPGASPVDARFRELCLLLAEEGLRLANISADPGKILDSGAALAAFRRIVQAQGGDVAQIDDVSRLPSAPCVRSVLATEEGYIRSVDAEAIGHIVVALGGGRRVKEDPVDPAVGIVLHTAVGMRVSPGDRLADIHARTEADAQAVLAGVLSAFSIGPEAVSSHPLVYRVVS